MKSMNAHQRALLIASVVSVLIWVLPIVRHLYLPIDYLLTYVHEICHAIVMSVTGGQVQRILVNPDGSGVTLGLGGSALLVAPAGYMGSSIVGAGVIAMSRTAKGARLAMRIILGVVAVSLVLWVRGVPIGVAAGIMWVLILAWAQFRLNSKSLMLAGAFLGVQLCLHSIVSVLTLLKITESYEVMSDASNMASITHVPAILWALLWCLFSFVVVGITIGRTWRAVADGF